MSVCTLQHALLIVSLQIHQLELYGDLSNTKALARLPFASAFIPCGCHDGQQRQRARHSGRHRGVWRRLCSRIARQPQQTQGKDAIRRRAKLIELRNLAVLQPRRAQQRRDAQSQPVVSAGKQRRWCFNNTTPSTLQPACDIQRLWMGCGRDARRSVDALSLRFPLATGRASWQCTDRMASIRLTARSGFSLFKLADLHSAYISAKQRTTPDVAPVRTVQVGSGGGLTFLKLANADRHIVATGPSTQGGVGVWRLKDIGEGTSVSPRLPSHFVIYRALESFLGPLTWHISIYPTDGSGTRLPTSVHLSPAGRPAKPWRPTGARRTALRGWNRLRDQFRRAHHRRTVWIRSHIGLLVRQGQADRVRRPQR